MNCILKNVVLLFIFVDILSANVNNNLSISK